MRYDPEAGPHPDTWLELGDDERLALAADYHMHKRIELPSVEAHALAHVIVENQLALNTPEVQETLRRLRAEGLSRHDAIHAIGSVLFEKMHRLMKEGWSARLTFDEEYAQSLRDLTAEGWLNSG